MSKTANTAKLPFNQSFICCDEYGCCFIYNAAPCISREVTAIICGIVACLGAGGGGEMKLTPAAIFCGDLDTN